MKKVYEFENKGGYCTLEIDLDKFTEEKAKETLDFFAWEFPYNKDKNLIDEVAKKYALECMAIATIKGYSILGVVEEMKDNEGFYSVEGSEGVKLWYVEGISLNDDDDLMTTTREEV